MLSFASSRRSCGVAVADLHPVLSGGIGGWMLISTRRGLARLRDRRTSRRTSPLCHLLNQDHCTNRSEPSLGASLGNM